MTRILDKLKERLAAPFRGKGDHELAYWRSRKEAEGQLSNDHYVKFYTSHFGFEPSFYAGKRVLDIGCGPRGSLEWANMAAERVGLDPLANEYLRLGADKHAMRYVASPAEKIPFADGHFDVVCSFNSLDHVDNLERTIAEIIRVVRPGGHVLLLTDVNHDPTPAEPIVFSWEVVDAFKPALECLEVRRYEKKAVGLYQSIDEALAYDDANTTRRYGVLSAKFRKPSASNDRA